MKKKWSQHLNLHSKDGVQAVPRVSVEQLNEIAKEVNLHTPSHAKTTTLDFDYWLNQMALMTNANKGKWFAQRVADGYETPPRMDLGGLRAALHAAYLAESLGRTGIARENILDAVNQIYSSGKFAVPRLRFSGHANHFASSYYPEPVAMDMLQKARTFSSKVARMEQIRRRLKEAAPKIAERTRTALKPKRYPAPPPAFSPPPEKDSKLEIEGAEAEIFDGISAEGVGAIAIGAVAVVGIGFLVLRGGKK